MKLTDGISDDVEPIRDEMRCKYGCSAHSLSKSNRALEANEHLLEQDYIFTYALVSTAVS